MAVYAVDTVCAVPGWCRVAHREMASERSVRSVERTLACASEKSFVVGGRALSTSPRWLKIHWMLFKKRIPAAFFDRTTCQSIHVDLYK